MIRILSDLAGTLRTAFKVARATISAVNLTANRTVTLSDHDMTLYDALVAPTANRIPLRDADNYLTLGRVKPDYIVNRIDANAGGRILLEVGSDAAISPTSRRLAIDTLLNSFRIYEGGDTARGLYIDVTTLAAGAATDYTKQVSNSDTTAERLKMVGGGGWMSQLSPIESTDLNSANYGQFYRYGGSAANRPSWAGATNSSGLFLPGGTNARGTQFFSLDANSTPRIAVRNLHAASTWGAWAELWHSLNFDPTTKADLSGATFTGQVTMPTNSRIVGNGSGAANVGYLSFYESNNTTRVGYVGDSSSGNSNITVSADIGDLNLIAAGGVLIGGIAVDNTDSGWINCTLVGGWASISGRPAQYRRIGKRVYLRGAIANATFANNNTAFWNVPSGYRLVRVPWVSTTSCGAFLASTPGAVVCSAASVMIAFDGVSTSGSVYVNLDNVSWECA